MNIDEIAESDAFRVTNDGDAHCKQNRMTMMTETNEYVLARDNQPGVKFRGRLLHRVCSDGNSGSHNYGGAVGRSTDHALYETQAGDYVCQTIHRTQWQGEQNSHQVLVCRTVDEVIEFFGQDWLAKQLFDAMGFDNAVEIA